MSRSIFLIVFSLFLTTAVLGINSQTVRWGQQLMSETDDVPRAAAVDNEGGIYCAFIKAVKDAPGFDGNVISKSWHLLKLNQKGEQLWTRLLDPEVAEVSGLKADDQGNIYVFGPGDSTDERKTKGKVDAYIAKYDQTGTQLWARLIGTPEFDICSGLDVDVNGNLYISGFTEGDFAKPNKGGQDMFIAAYNQDGSQRWRDQIGTAANERGGSICLGDDNDVYVCGDTSGSLARENNGLGDFFVARYRRTGERLWLQQFGTNASDRIMGMEVGELGHLYLGCRSNGKIGSRSLRSPGRTDLDSCLVTISKEGKLLWVRQFGPAYDHRGHALSFHSISAKHAHSSGAWNL